MQLQPGGRCREEVPLGLGLGLGLGLLGLLCKDHFASQLPRGRVGTARDELTGAFTQSRFLTSRSHQLKKCIDCPMPALSTSTTEILICWAETR